MSLRRAVCFVAVLALGLCRVEGAAAQAEPGALLELKYTPAPRAQVAIWVETGSGRFIRTLLLTDGVAYRGIGNRPGASLMNSGYHWPYGRREGVLPVWALRRASAPGASPWKRVIFQDRVSEGHASRSGDDASPDDYYCLSFDKTTTTRDALDAVSCASVFTSDKGRFITQSDLDADYSEPWEDPGPSGQMQKLSLTSHYPPRMDVIPCNAPSCSEHPDAALLADHAREIMPDIDAVTAATAPGGLEQSLLFSVPATWPAGTYVVLLEINVEGDYEVGWDPSAFPTPTLPSNAWDSWAITYGYPYRGQPSIVYRVELELSAVGEVTYGTATAIGRGSWDHWRQDFGEMVAADDMVDDPVSAPGSGQDRLSLDADGNRLTLRVETLLEPPPADPEVDPFPMEGGGETDPPSEDPPPGSETEPASSSGTSGGPGTVGEGGKGGSGGRDAASAGSAAEPDRPAGDGMMIEDDETDAVILVEDEAELDGPVGAVRALKLGRHRELLHAHEWITIRFRAARSSRALHEYEVRVAARPITDQASFIREGRPAKTATTDAEGAVKLMLPTDVPAGDVVSGAIGGLTALTEYYVAVRARDRSNRTGPISVARITTPRRTFSTVTPCFVASVAYGTPLASEVSVLRGLRDRHLLAHAPGRALVAAYYDVGGALAQLLRERPWLSALSRAVLEPLVAFARWLDQAGA